MNTRALNSIATFCTLVSATAFGDATATFTLPSGVAVQIEESAFDKANFKVEGCSGRAPHCKINDHIPFGTDLSLPKTYIKSMVVSFDGTKHQLDTTNMYNAWGRRPLEYKGTIRYFGGKCHNKNSCQFRGLFSDAAGSFVAEWKIINGIPTRTVLTDSNDIVHLFMQNIDPPEYE